MAGKRRGRGDLKRRVTTAAVRRELLVFTEGRVTEPGYLTYWHRRFRATVNVEIDERHGRAPLQLVELAVEAKDLSEREARRGGGRAYDEVWCVFDIDDHPNVEAAVDLAGRNQVSVAISSPCVELWFVLHFQDQTAHIERRPLKSLAKRLLGCDKALDDAALRALDGRIDDARARAQALERKHIGDGSPPASNPSSGLWRLINVIESA